MATYPGGIVSLTNPTATDSMLTVNHAAQHSNVNDEVEAIETALGANLGNVVPSSRTVNSKALTSNIVLDKTDVGLGNVANAAQVTGVTATGPITVSGTSAAAISTSMATNKLIGRGSASTGVMEEIGIGSGLTMTGTTLSAAGGASITRATFGSASLSTAGELAITHSLALAAPYSTLIFVYDNTGALVIPDSVTGTAGTVTVVLGSASWGTIAGTWGYALVAG